MPAESSIYDQAHTKGGIFTIKHTPEPCFCPKFTIKHMPLTIKHMAPRVLDRKFQADFSSQRLRNFNQASPPPRLRIFLNSQKRNCWVRGFQEPRAIAAAV
jgi:hypothetical protein